MPDLLPPLQNWLDYLAIALFFGSWFVYGRAADNYQNPSRPSLLVVMHRMRARWLTEMQFRPLRMPDAMILNIATGNYTFFASTSILIIAGAFTLFLASTDWLIFLSRLPLVNQPSLALTPVKLFIIILCFVYSFFKFTWSIRQVSYCAIVLGGIANRYHDESSAPPPPAEYQNAQKRAEVIAPLFTLAGNNFNYGLRAYYFGLAILPWFIGPLWLMASAAVIVFILWQREFNSKTLHYLLRAEEELNTPR